MLHKIYKIALRKDKIFYIGLCWRMTMLMTQVFNNLLILYPNWIACGRFLIQVGIIVQKHGIKSFFNGRLEEELL